MLSEILKQVLKRFLKSTQHWPLSCSCAHWPGVGGGGGTTACLPGVGRPHGAWLPGKGRVICNTTWNFQRCNPCLLSIRPNWCKNSHNGKANIETNMPLFEKKKGEILALNLMTISQFADAVVPDLGKNCPYLAMSEISPSQQRPALYKDHFLTGTRGGH